jgi:hypothetical protein
VSPTQQTTHNKRKKNKMATKKNKKETKMKVKVRDLRPGKDAKGGGGVGTGHHGGFGPHC